MKIVFIAIKGIHVTGGIETYTREIGLHLVRQGHEVVVYTMSQNDGHKPFIFAGIRVIPLPVIKHRVFAKLNLVLAASIHQFSLADVDVLHYHAIGPSIFNIIPRLFGRKAIVQSHGHEWNRSSWGGVGKAFFKITEYLTFKTTRDITAVSAVLKNDYERKYQQNVVYIPNAVTIQDKLPVREIRRFGLKGDDYILFLGRISREKNLDLLIKAYQALDGETSTKLVIVGDSREGDAYLEELIKLAGAHKNIIFAGAAKGWLWNEWYSHCRAFVLPSETEGLPLSLLEAMSFSCVCLVSDIKANVEAIGDAGVIFKCNDVASLSSALRQVLDKGFDAQGFKKRAFSRVEQVYNWDSVTRQLIEFYQGKQAVASAKKLAYDNGEMLPPSKAVAAATKKGT